MTVEELLDAALPTVHLVQLLDDVAIVRFAGVDLINRVTERLSLNLDDLRQ